VAAMFRDPDDDMALNVAVCGELFCRVSAAGVRPEGAQSPQALGSGGRR